MGVIGRSLSGVARGQRALLEADDAVGDVRGVRVDRRHADRREMGSILGTIWYIHVQLQEFVARIRSQLFIHARVRFVE